MKADRGQEEKERERRKKRTTNRRRSRGDRAEKMNSRVATTCRSANMVRIHHSLMNISRFPSLVSVALAVFGKWVTGHSRAQLRIPLLSFSLMVLSLQNDAFRVYCCSNSVRIRGITALYNFTVQIKKERIIHPFSICLIDGKR